MRQLLLLQKSYIGQQDVRCWGTRATCCSSIYVGGVSGFTWGEQENKQDIHPVYSQWQGTRASTTLPDWTVMEEVATDNSWIRVDHHSNLLELVEHHIGRQMRKSVMIHTYWLKKVTAWLLMEFYEVKATVGIVRVDYGLEVPSQSGWKRPS